MRSRLTIAAILSLLLHLVAVATIVRSASGAPARMDVEAERTRLGIERSDATTVTWIGFEEPTPNEAPEADSAQAAMTTEAPAAPEVTAPETAEESRESPAESRPDPSETATESEAAPPEPDPADAPATSPLPEIDRPGEDVPVPTETSPSPDVAPIPEDLSDFAKRPSSTSKRDASEARETEAKAQDSDAPESDAPPTPPEVEKSSSEAAPPSELDGHVSDKESAATSEDPPLEYRPGRPVAREGLEIATRRPKFSTLTRLTARARDPVVEFWFQKDGTVRKALLVVRSGDERVDQDVLNAAYNWTAKGRAIDELKGGSHVTVRVRFAL